MKRYWVPRLGRTVRLSVSSKGIKTIDQSGVARGGRGTPSGSPGRCGWPRQGG
ncbi:MAG: mitochondrial large ribosomal subunit protein bL28m [Nocardioidaceae bacterium]|nr:mitochondrial large ribosomal subunit protein bL28m [Nocardioidaceae bacterium]